MSKFTVPGLDKSDGVVFRPLPTGKYAFRISGIEEKETGPKSKHPGEPMLEFTCKVMAPGTEHDEAHLRFWLVLPAPYMDSRSLKMNTDKIKRLLIACDLESADDSFETEDLFGAEFCAVVKEKDNQNDVADYLPLGELDSQEALATKEE